MLTDAKISGLKAPESGRLEVPDKLVPGLRVRVGSGGAKAFTLRTRIAGKPVNLTLGRYPQMSLAKAREAARAALVEIGAGRDPTARRHVQRRAGGAVAAGSVAEWWNLYLERAVRGRLRSGGEIERRGRRWILPALGHRQIETVTRADISRLVEDIAYSDPAAPRLREGRHVQQVLSAFFSWAMPMLDNLPSNPARDAMRPPLSPPRERVLDDAEIAAFWRAAEAMGYPFGDGFRLQLLTACRRGEVFGMGWGEIEGDGWTIPASRSKNKRAHFVPLSRQALELIDALPHLAGPLLFPATRVQRAGDVRDDARPVSGFSKAWPRLVAAMEADMGRPVPTFTPHDLRRTAATGMQRLGIALPVIEAALNHVSGTRAGIVGTYQRHDFAAEKRHALEAWGAEVARIVEGGPADKVVLMRKRRAT
jgi:integrase